MKIYSQEFNLDIGFEVKELPVDIITFQFGYYLNNRWIRHGAKFLSYNECLKHALYYCDPSIGIVKIYLSATKNKNEIYLLINANKILAGIIDLPFV